MLDSGGGGSKADAGQAVAVSGTDVYVTGYFSNTAANDYGVTFGGTGTTPGTVPVRGVANASYIMYYEDIVVAKYTDQGASATLGWTQVGGGGDSDKGLGVAVSGTTVYAAGYVTPSIPAPSFGSIRIGTPINAVNLGNNTLVLARLTDSFSPLSVPTAQPTDLPTLVLTVSPNPSLPNTLVQATGRSVHTGPAELVISDVVGQVLWRQTVHLTSGMSAPLPVPVLPGPGLYLLRLQAADGNAVSTRLVRE